MIFESERKCLLPLPDIEEGVEQGFEYLERAGKALDTAFREIHQLEEVKK